MQLQLETGELDVIANVLLEWESQQTATASGPPDTRAGADFKMCEELLDRVVARDLAFDSDELQQLADILENYQRRLHDAVAQESQPAVKAKLQKKLDKLAHVVERVEEVCVMF